MKQIDKRLANLERASGASKKDSLTVWVAYFGSEATTATSNGVTIQRTPDESLEDFETRAERELPPPKPGVLRVIFQGGTETASL
jgi:hypothetical protein